MQTDPTEEVLKLLAMRVRALRRERQLTQRQLALLAGLAEGTVSRLEQRHEPPTLTSLARISAALGVPPGALFAETPVGRRPARGTTDSAQERELLELWRRLDQRARRQMLALGRLLASPTPQPGRRRAKKKNVRSRHRQPN